jgi:hypothetical protein
MLSAENDCSMALALSDVLSKRSLAAFTMLLNRFLGCKFQVKTVLQSCSNYWLIHPPV